ncbi:MAG: ABC transporter permease [Deltaproteobacteria bacterium]|nr:ABC transporter permease [Deltaproteobacteria bacterium]
MRIESHIGLRFLKAPRQTRSISVITWISAVGVMLGVTALIIAISVMNGFRENMTLAVTGTVPNMRVMPKEGTISAEEARALKQRLEAVPGVRAVAPYFSRQAFIRNSDEFRAVVLRGVDPQAELDLTQLGLFLRDRVLLDLDLEEAPPVTPGEIMARLVPRVSGERAGIIMGLDLARGLGLRLGDEVEVVSTTQRMTPIGPVPLMKKFRLAGVFQTGVGATDEVTAYVAHRYAGRLFRLGENSLGFGLRMDSLDTSPAPVIEAAGDGYRVTGWAEENRNLFQVMRLEKVGVFLILILIIVVSFFNIISSLVMLVLEKRGAIAVLMSLGATRGLVRRVFFMQGVWIGALGTLSGLSLGLLGCWLLKTYDLVPLPQGVFPLARHLPVRVDWQDLALITGTSFIICLLVTLYPAGRAAGTDPVVNLRNE